MAFHYEKQDRVSPKKLKMKLLCDPLMPLLGVHPKEMKPVSQRYLYSHAHCSVTHNSQDTDTHKCLSIEKWIF